VRSQNFVNRVTLVAVLQVLCLQYDALGMHNEAFAANLFMIVIAGLFILDMLLDVSRGVLIALKRWWRS
jgi:hypothetical protein